MSRSIDHEAMLRHRARELVAASDFNRRELLATFILKYAGHADRLRDFLRMQAAGVCRDEPEPYMELLETSIRTGFIEHFGYDILDPLNGT